MGYRDMIESLLLKTFKISSYVKRSLVKLSKRKRKDIHMVFITCGEYSPFNVTVYI